jgi:uncharacterized protein with GYD domain
MTARAFVLVNTAAGKAPAVRDALGREGGPSIHGVDVVIGPHDLVVSVEAADMDALAKLVLDTIHGIDGVVNTLTYPVVQAA